jgi:hypothetical protein
VFVVAGALALIVVAVFYQATHLEPRSKFFGPAPVTRVDAVQACAVVPTVPSASEICFPLSILDSSPWSSAGTTWRPAHTLAVGDCVSLNVNQEDVHEVRAARWLGATGC